MLPLLPDWEQTSWEFWTYPSYSLAQVMEMCTVINPPLPLQGHFRVVIWNQGGEVKTDLCPLTSLACRCHSINRDSILNSAASPHFKLNSQAVCFSPSKMTNRGSTFLSEPLRWAHWSSPRPSVRANKHRLFAVVQQRNTPQLDKAFWHLRRLCAAVFVWVCQSVFRELCSYVDRLPGLQFSLGISLFCSRDDTSKIVLLDEPPALMRWSVASWETRRF